MLRFNLVIEKLLIPTIEAEILEEDTTVEFQSRNRETFDSNRLKLSETSQVNAVSIS